jgi:hypothetical protein
MSYFRHLKDSGMTKKKLTHRIAAAVPLFGKAVMFLKGKNASNPDFQTSEQYWKQRYEMGGNSGAGSYSRLAEFKAEVLNQFVKENDISTVIEFGSGDGNQLKYLTFPGYIGFDISPKAVEDCRSIYGADGTKQFLLLEDYAGEKAQLTLSLDVIFHLIEDSVFDAYMRRLFEASEKYVIIYSSNQPNEEFEERVPHVKHRRFTDWTTQHAAEFKLLSHIPNKYPFDGDGSRSSYSDFFVFGRKGEED